MLTILLLFSFSVTSAKIDVTTENIISATIEHMGFNAEFVNWIRREMDLRDWSQSDLSRASKLAHSTISSVMNGERSAGIEFCSKIAAAFRIPAAFVQMKAGLLPPDTHKDPLDEEIDFKLTLLPPEKKQIVLDLINGLIIREERENRLSKGGDADK